MGTSPKASLTTSPARSWGSQRKALDMKALGRRNVQGSPDSRTAVSERIMYSDTALRVSVATAARLDSSTTRATPARRILASRPGMSS